MADIDKLPEPEVTETGIRYPAGIKWTGEKVGEAIRKLKEAHPLDPDEEESDETSS